MEWKQKFLVPILVKKLLIAFIYIYIFYFYYFVVPIHNLKHKNFLNFFNIHVLNFAKKRFKKKIHSQFLENIYINVCVSCLFVFVHNVYLYFFFNFGENIFFFLYFTFFVFYSMIFRFFFL